MSFSEKQKLLFDSLSAAEKNISGSLSSQLIPVPDVRELSSRPCSNKFPKTKKFRGKDSIFKRPEAPLANCLKSIRTPDFKVNPHKWKRYTLEDVDISDRSNSAAAFAFLDEIEKRKSSGGDNDDIITDISKIKKPAFNKSIALKNRIGDGSTSTDKSAKTQIRGSKVMMPEYVIGQKARKSKRDRSGNAKADQKQLKLDHLMENDEEVDE